VLWSIVVGMLGGVANSLLIEEGFVIPHWVRQQNCTVWKPGFLSNIVLGGIAALATYFLGASELKPLSQLGIALISGMGGGNILVSLMQKQETALLKTRVDTLQAIVRGASSDGNCANS
jgi:ABC-type Mn2+/Zn2+ transport system permease subunit